MTLEEKVALYKELRAKIEELENQKKNLVTEILELMPKETKSIQVADSMLRRYSQLSIKISVENAKILDAVKTQEVVDRDKIRKLYACGEQIPDVEEIQYIRVCSFSAEK